MSLVALGAGTYAEVHAGSLEDQAALQSSQADRQRLKDDASGYRSKGEIILVTGSIFAVAAIVRLTLLPGSGNTPTTNTTTAFRTSLDVGLGWVGASGRF